MRHRIHPTAVMVDTKMSSLTPHVLSWLWEGMQELSNATILDGWGTAVILRAGSLSSSRKHVTEF